ncbi:DUF2637 domain-containing protein [Actinomadura latina]|uniref:DUF2637 domain-containing protein n=1 Tax=Actinomadura latina TaxID=163603 RepID=A0A846Z4G6_9ACTN|nr:DUF2637 domain-containing protein [Actinomadura latina]NKZ06122.1 DUF2637 domain-containing protein [Actinomadura latina]
MPSDPTRPSFTRAQRRLLTALAGLLVAALAAGAYVLTYDVLRELALAGRVSRRWAPLYPAMADTLVAMTIMSLVVTRNARWWTRLLRWTLLLVLVAGGAAASVQHSVRGYAPLPDDAVRAGVAVAPHVMLVIAIWLWLTMFKQIRVVRPAAEETPPVETQRGHVKVLEPAAPPPLALEPPADAEPLVPFEPETADEEPLIPFPPEPPAAHEPPEHEPAERESAAQRPAAHEMSDPEPVPAQPAVQVPAARRPAADIPDEDEPAGNEPAGDKPAVNEPAGDEPHAREEFEVAGYGGGLSSEPAPPLDALPEPRPPLDPVPALLPTDVELVRGRDREDAEPRPMASTTRPDIVMPGAEEDLHDTPTADRAEDPDAGDPAAEDWNPPPSGSFRSGPTPPAD